ncbi:hypothetical protein N7510_011651 [Penicillium lagena]|uniref:uncharacterized protein n=1 Tax=Penicillium lagena TaxID=94218 RepID=UPI00254187BE|nr:uncharacterized protein N7510_011651 [Penicillium lagena]KAJ5602117.1 hypothetical protein N7510_011651 [Penicillium lagena]
MSDPASSNTLDPSASAPKKRTRVQFSCTACRYRNPTLVQDRLQHLENLVMSLAQKNRSGEPVDINFNESLNDEDGGYATPSPSSERETKSPPLDAPGKLVVKNEEISYIDSANWRAILEEINGVKEYLDENGEHSDDEGVEDDPYDNSSPALLLSMGRPVSIEELLIDIPAQSVVDRLVSRFLKTSDPSLAPHEVSFTWLALLYAIMTLSVSLYHRSEEPLPVAMADAMLTWNIFRKRGAQCLVQANYLIPGRYKTEALFLYSLGEFYRSQDAQIGVSYLLGITIKLAMRMGYHRDPRHYTSLTALEGEMRRRHWALLCQFDTLISFQVGLPRTIQPWHYDTELPSNLMDTDFDETTAQLPPPRPEGERTMASYTRCKSRIMRVFGQITDLAYSRDHMTYEEALEIDRRLEEAHDMLPQYFQIRPMAQCIADPAELIMRRYTLELLYQKSRVVLHRRYMAEAPRNQRYSYSQGVCLAAATETLRHHAEIWNESMPGGQLYHERQFINSFQNTDFLLSAMILCLELSRDGERGDGRTLNQRQRTDLLVLLETTQRIFKESRRRSNDMQRAFVALTIMLDRVKSGARGSIVQNTDEKPVMPMDGKFLFSFLLL